jgi:hypothetical protein
MADQFHSFAAILGTTTFLICYLMVHRLQMHLCFRFVHLPQIGMGFYICGWACLSDFNI